MLTVMVPILINDDVFEPSYEDLKFTVQNRNSFCTNPTASLFKPSNLCKISDSKLLSRRSQASLSTRPASPHHSGHSPTPSQMSSLSPKRMDLRALGTGYPKALWASTHTTSPAGRQAPLPARALPTAAQDGAQRPAVRSTLVSVTVLPHCEPPIPEL